MTINEKTALHIATATRLLVMEGIMDYSGHISARLPGTDNIMIQSANDSRAGVEPSRILTVDMNGNVVDGSEKPPLELDLHLEILKVRPDVQTVLHCHMDLALTFTLMKNVQLLPMRAHAVRWESGIPTHPDPGHISTPEQGRELADTLGPHHATLIRSHGMILVAESVPSVFVDAIHFLENAKQHLLVLQAGQQPLPLTKAEMRVVKVNRAFHVEKLWNYYVGQGKSRGLLPLDWSADA
ncbi:class II aldolase/adducin family protein [Rhizobium leguminosarum]|uniref:class II aldolase/adducin family protein n=1 Tax=Rhizobium leguminosarum TaxID=384 RepID=UPI001C96DCEB|nr:class II aldolase/adducin family protein [Rhizobium leguminosarum]MBY5775155.1 class II aldolase/adducin family protein [Rhizobium leguminosarum]